VATRFAEAAGAAATQLLIGVTVQWNDLTIYKTKRFKRCWKCAPSILRFFQRLCIFERPYSKFGKEFIVFIVVCNNRA